MNGKIQKWAHSIIETFKVMGEIIKGLKWNNKLEE
jgi:hypothetical protein